MIFPPLNGMPPPCGGPAPRPSLDGPQPEVEPAQSGAQAVASRGESPAGAPAAGYQAVIGEPATVQADRRRPAVRHWAAVQAGQLRTAADLDPRLRAARADLQEAERLRRLILAQAGPRTEANTLAPYNLLLLRLDDAAATAGLLAAVHPERQTRGEAEAVAQDARRLATAIGLDRGLYDALSALRPEDLDQQARRFLTKQLEDCRRSGVDRDEATRARVKELTARLVEVGQAFGRHIREDVRAITLAGPQALAGLPPDYLAAHPPDSAGQITITTDAPDYVPFMRYAQDAGARRALAAAYLDRGHPANQPVLAELLRLRHELATLLGAPSWAAHVAQDKMIKSQTAIAAFIEQAAAMAAPRCERDLAELLAAKRRDEPHAERVEAWEQAYYSERARAARYDLDARTVRSYFEYHAVKRGLLELLGELYGLRFEPAPGASVWHPSVEAYDVRDERGAALGRVYLDMHPREGKHKHAAQFTLRTGLVGQQLPEGVLVCNFPDPSQGPALMDHSQVTTFCHELGHLMHHILGGQQRWASFSGVATEWDFVELPSQLNEELAWDPAVLARFARHHQSGEPIPAELVERMRAARDFGLGIHVRHQMFLAALALRCHDQDPARFDVHELVGELQARYSPIPRLPGSHFELGFGHLNGYSALYYTYLWSLVIAKDVAAGFPRGPLDREAARRYRQAVLEPGGSKDAAQLVADFLGRPYSFEAFRRWLAGDGPAGARAG